jgi:hypothetical protein
VSSWSVGSAVSCLTTWASAGLSIGSRPGSPGVPEGRRLASRVRHRFLSFGQSLLMSLTKRLGVAQRYTRLGHQHLKRAQSAMRRDADGARRATEHVGDLVDRQPRDHA